MNQYRCEKCNKIVLEIISRIQKQPELENSWNGMANAEKNYFVGDIFNIVSSHHSDFQADREKVLDVDTIGTLLNIVEKDCDRLTVLERQAYRKAKTYERKLRQSKDGE